MVVFVNDEPCITSLLPGLTFVLSIEAINGGVTGTNVMFDESP
jgi:hypothetical protein